MALHVDFLGPIVDPEKSGISREEAVDAWVEDYAQRGGKTRNTVRGDLGL
jgi:hypothetical protein